jgi:hypothetical protein
MRKMQRPSELPIDPDFEPYGWLLCYAVTRVVFSQASVGAGKEVLPSRAQREDRYVFQFVPWLQWPLQTRTF